jgi:hypothetical protein
MERKEEPTCSKLDFENLKLTEREWKGYVFEVEVQNILLNLGFSLYEANPVSEYAWKHDNIHHKVDITLANGLRIECKNIDGKIYLSWFKRDWKSKGTCIFVYRGDLKLSPNIYSDFHPIVFHYFLLPVYLKYELPLFRGVTRFFEPITIKNFETRKYVTKRLELESSGNRTVTQSMVLSSKEKRLADESINLEAPSKGVPIPSSSLQVKTWKLEDVRESTHGG